MGKSVIDLLNDGRARELHAILQYMAQHYELEDQGYGKLADAVKKVAIVEMKHAEMLAERILFLQGVPISKPAAEAKKGLDIPAMLKVDVGLETDAIKMYNDSAKACNDMGDLVSKDLFEQILGQEDDHLNDFQTTLEHVEKLGGAYLATLLD